MVPAGILVLTAVWHGLAFYHFAFHPARTLARTTFERPVNGTATELFRFLGAMNIAFTALALASLALAPGARIPTFLCLAIANASQLAVDLRVRRRGLVHGPFFAQVLAGDALFTVLNTVGLLWSWAS